jgi:hypothetical protein
LRLAKKAAEYRPASRKIISAAGPEKKVIPGNRLPLAEPTRSPRVTLLVLIRKSVFFLQTKRESQDSQLIIVAVLLASQDMHASQKTKNILGYHCEKNKGGK